MSRRSFVPPRVSVARVAAVAVAASIALATPRSVRGQANIPVFRGDVGLLAGTQTAPGAYLSVLFNDYYANRVTDGRGSSISHPTRADLFGLWAEYSSPWKIAGGRWAAIVATTWMNADLTIADLAAGTKWGFSDTYVLPLQLGWTFKRADMVFGQGFFAPTGRFHVDSRSSTGYGMWSWESTLGGTGYFDKARTSSLSTLLSYQVQSDVRGSDRRAGNVLTLEGGLGQNVAAIKGRLGAVYYAQWKTTSDRDFPLPAAFDRRDRYLGFGLEVTSGYVRKPLLTVFTARYYTELWNRVAPEGNSLFLIAKVSRPPRPKTR